MTSLFGQNVKHLLDITGTSNAALARGVEVSGASVSDWLSGESKSVDGHNLVKVADFFGVAAASLLRDDLTDLKVEDLRGIYKVGSASVGTRNVPVARSAGVDKSGYWTDVIVSAGVPDAQYIRYPIADAAAFALAVEGDSLRPRYKPGEYLIVSPATEPEPGHEVLVRTGDGKVTVRVFDWRRGGLVQLSSVNEDQRPITVTESGIKGLFRIVGVAQAELLVYTNRSDNQPG